VETVAKESELPTVRAAARAAVAVALLAVHTPTAANPGLKGRYDLPVEAERAGCNPEDLWAKVREAVAAWALGDEGEIGGGERAYSPKASFQEGETILHPKFGRGVVRVRRKNKIDVEFEDGVKTLIHELGQ
jgi:hypothetical protein